MEQKILVIDDERDLCEILQFYLTSAGYLVHTAHSGEEALAMGISNYDLLLLDVMMPGLSGFDLAERLKRESGSADVPIIFLTALNEEEDTLHGFDLGADDYIAKPFSVREVVARVRAVLGRTSPSQSGARELTYDGLVMDLAKMTVTIDGEAAPLTKTEFELLKLFLEKRGRLFSRQELLEKVWPKDVVVTDRTVDVNLARMRKKIGRYSSCIVTRHGYGYLFVV